jgi:hypothetical protein
MIAAVAVSIVCAVLLTSAATVISPRTLTAHSVPHDAGTE